MAWCSVKETAQGQLYLYPLLLSAVPHTFIASIISFPGMYDQVTALFELPMYITK
jgi:hypothetical protein